MILLRLATGASLIGLVDAMNELRRMKELENARKELEKNKEEKPVSQKINFNVGAKAPEEVKQALYDLDHSLSPDSVKSIEVQRQQVKERAFYQLFLDKLGALV